MEGEQPHLYWDEMEVTEEEFRAHAGREHLEILGMVRGVAMTKKSDRRAIRVFSFWDGGFIGEWGEEGEFRAPTWPKMKDMLHRRGYPDHADRSILQRLYDSEINVSVSFLRTGRLEMGLGDDWNGFDARTELKSWDNALRWFREKGVACYPNSEFAKTERRHSRGPQRE